MAELILSTMHKQPFGKYVYLNGGFREVRIERLNNAARAAKGIHRASKSLCRSTGYYNCVFW